jgi:nucleoside permease NupC
MLYEFLLLIPVVFVLVAGLCALAISSGSPTVRRAAYRAVYGSCIVALISAAAVAWFFHSEH